MRRLRHTLRRLRRDGQAGFGLVELLIAMVVLNVGLIALIAAFSAGSATVRRTSRVATASTLADSQLERYRAITYTSIALDSTAVAATDSTYRADTALPGGSTANLITASCPTLPNECNPSRTQSGPDGGSYRIDTYIVTKIPTGGRALKLVTVVVRDANSVSAAPWIRRSTSFDASTGS